MSHDASGKRIAETGCGVFSGLVGCLIAPFALLVVVLLIGFFLASLVPSERTTPPAPTTPARSTTSGHPVKLRVGTTHVCAYCGAKVRETRREVLYYPGGGGGKPETQTVADAICPRKLCQKAAKLRAKHPAWPREICQVIVQRKVRIGMTREQAAAAWGKPRDINRTTNAYGVSEQWCYGEIPSSFLYFDDGILTSVQN